MKLKWKIRKIKEENEKKKKETSKRKLKLKPTLYLALPGAEKGKKESRFDYSVQ